MKDHGPKFPHPPEEPDRDCDRCPRLAGYRRLNRRVHPGFHNAPVSACGSAHPMLLVVGLAPGLRGANRTGIPFLGDAGAGDFLRAGLARAGFTEAGPLSFRLTNALRCVPPDNRPSRAELSACAPFLASEIAATNPPVVLALGTIAHDAVLGVAGAGRRDHPFSHAARHALPAFVLFDSYHTSRQNTQTGRLTGPMFDTLLNAVRSACLASSALHA